MATRHGNLYEGVIAGFLGATAVALWFLGVDIIDGAPLQTPALLGRALLDVFGPRGPEGVGFLVGFYTVFHYAAFSVLGIIVAAVIHRADRTPAVLAGLLLMFAVFEVSFYFLALVLSQPTLIGSLAWYQVAASNLLAASVMGVFLWRRHPALGREFSEALSGADV